jgi:hypothetical protein
MVMKRRQERDNKKGPSSGKPSQNDNKPRFRNTPSKFKKKNFQHKSKHGGKNR